MSEGPRELEQRQMQELQESYPDWEFGVVWTAAPSGPDMRQLYAKCGRVKVVAYNPRGLGRLIKEHQDQGEIG